MQLSTVHLKIHHTDSKSQNKKKVSTTKSHHQKLINPIPNPLANVAPYAPRTIFSARSFDDGYPGIRNPLSFVGVFALLSVWLIINANVARPIYGVNVTADVLVYINRGTLYLMHKLIITLVPAVMWKKIVSKNCFNFVASDATSQLLMMYNILHWDILQYN